MVTWRACVPPVQNFFPQKTTMTTNAHGGHRAEQAGLSRPGPAAGESKSTHWLLLRRHIITHTGGSAGNSLSLRTSRGDA